MVGEVRASGGLQSQLISDRSSQISAQAGSGLGDAINQLAQTTFGYMNSRTDIEQIYDRRAQASIGLELDTELLQYQQDRAKEYAEMSRDRSASPRGMTADYNAHLAQKEEEFLKRVPERQREEYKARLARDRGERVGSAFRGELELMDNADSAALNRGLNTLGTNIKGKAVSLEDAEAEWEALVGKSTLPEITKQAFVENGKATLQGLAFGSKVEEAAAGYGEVGDGSDGGLAAAGLTPQEAGVLMGIAAEESPGYDVWNGGDRFQGYDDHPARTTAAPGESTAAGKYQFILSTWDAAKASYEAKYGIKVPNFRPEWQDRVALHWAEKRYNELNGKGLTFRGALASGDREQLLDIKRVLGEPRGDNPLAVEWQGLGPMDDDKFIAIMGGAAGTGAADAPNVWTDPRYANVPLDAKLSFANQAALLAEQQRLASAQQIKLERASFLDEVYNLGYTGDPRAADGLRQSPQWDAEADAKFQSGQAVFRNSEAQVGLVAEQLGSGQRLPASSAGPLGKLFGEPGFVGIANGDPAAYARYKNIVETGRVLPEGSVAAFRSALANPQAAAAAIGFLASMHAGDVNLLSKGGFSQEDIADVQLYKNIAARSDSAETAYQEYTLAKDAATRLGKSPATLSKEANEIWVESYPAADDLAYDLFGGWFAREPDMTLDQNVGAQFMLDAGSAFQDGYKIYGTEAGAKAYMESYISKTWGVTYTRGAGNEAATRGDTVGLGGAIAADRRTPVLMRYAPENHFTMNDPELLYEEISTYAVAMGATKSDAVLMSDDTTDKEVRAGKLPTYRVIGRGEFGDAKLLPGRFGGETLQNKLDKPMLAEADQKSAMATVDTTKQNWSKLNSQLLQAVEAGKPQDQIDLLANQVNDAQILRDKALDEAVAGGYLSRSSAETAKFMGDY